MPNEELYTQLVGAIISTCKISTVNVIFQLEIAYPCALNGFHVQELSKDLGKDHVHYTATCPLQHQPQKDSAP